MTAHNQAGSSRPAFAFAGIWRPWTGTRGTKPAAHKKAAPVGWSG